jgi:hypothetical protein
MSGRTGPTCVLARTSEHVNLWDVEIGFDCMEAKALIPSVDDSLLRGG